MIETTCPALFFLPRAGLHVSYTIRLFAVSYSSDARLSDGKWMELALSALAIYLCFFFF